MNAIYRHACGSVLLAAALGACSGGQDSAPATMEAPAAVQTRAVRSTSGAEVFTGNVSQYTINRDALSVTDIVTGSARTVGANALLSFADTTVALDLAGSPGQAYRMYQAAFNRKPDLGGLGFQINALNAGFTLQQIAQNFIDSPEFSATYGALNTTAFVTLLYQNVLKRAPDAGGLAFYVSHLDGSNGDGIVFTRAQVLQGFSESPENQSLVLPDIRNGIEYTPFGTSPPSDPVADFAANYTGNLSGADAGVLVLTVAADGVVTATAHSNAANADLIGTGTLVAGGKFTVTASGGARSLAFSGSINLANGLATGRWTGSGGDAGVFNAARVITTPTYSQVRAVIVARCLPCHSVNPTMADSPPAGITFDSEAQIRARISQINSVAVESNFMPFGNATDMTDEERDLLRRWIAAGSP
jgi:hypothetical protein